MIKPALPSPRCFHTNALVKCMSASTQHGPTKKHTSTSLRLLLTGNANSDTFWSFIALQAIIFFKMKHLFWKMLKLYSNIIDDLNSNIIKKGLILITARAMLRDSRKQYCKDKLHQFPWCRQVNLKAITPQHHKIMQTAGISRTSKVEQRREDRRHNPRGVQRSLSRSTVEINKRDIFF